jgi:GT2 family glycosyltransferase
VAIRQISIEHLNQGIQYLEGFQQVLVVFRSNGAVVGTAWFPVIKGKVNVAQLQSVVPKIAWPVWLQITAQMGKPTIQLPSATVVVCTRNRTSDLAASLPALAKLAGDGHQILIVDNSPSDDSTARLLASYPEIRYICEPRAGLDIARNRGIMEAHGEVVAFVDDDAIPDDGWLEALRENFADPTVAVVTGITMPLELETQAQQWFEKTNGFNRGFERKFFDSLRMSVVGAGQVGAGVNMAIRRSALGEIGLFDEALDGGTPTLSGGDQEFFYRVMAHGYRIVYDPRALVWHKHRREWNALRQTILGYGVGLYAWWSKALFVEKEFSLLYWGTMWFIQRNLGNLIRSVIRRPGCVPLDLVWAELCGAVIGPYRYLRSRRMQKRESRRIVDRPTAGCEQAALEASMTDSLLAGNEVYIPGMQSGAEIP